MKQNEIKFKEIKEGDYRIYISHEFITIQHLDYPKVLKIDKVTANVSETDQSVISKITVLSVIRPHALLGIIKIEDFSYLMYVATSELIGSINADKEEVFKVLEVNFIPLQDEDKHRLSNSNEIENYLNSIKNLLTMGFYYSFKYNLTNSCQKQSKLKKDSNIWLYDKRYCWNYYLNKKLFEAKVNSIWITPCIFGYVNISTVQLASETVKFVLISRRSNKHAGTRYNTRGIIESGHVANYVETEQILKMRNNLYSVVILRGSVPIFFEQKPSNLEVSISKNPSMTSEAFQKHLNLIQQEYKYVLMMNLMNESKPEEELISSNFKNQFSINESHNCKYHVFDLHKICKKDSFGKLEEYIDDKLLKIMENFNFYCESEDKKNNSLQKGVFRINCLDCLDRTNIFQSRFCWQILINQVL